jgi:hypothetical protein
MNRQEEWELTNHSRQHSPPLFRQFGQGLLLPLKIHGLVGMYY